MKICQILSQGGFTIKHLVKNASKIAQREKQWIAYDDPETVYQKVKLLRQTFVMRRVINQLMFVF